MLKIFNQNLNAPYSLLRGEQEWLLWVQSQKIPVSASAMLSGKFLQIRKVFAKRLIFGQNSPVGKETVRMVWKLSGQSTYCPGNLETARIIQLSRQLKNCPHDWKTIQKLSGQNRNCPDNLELVWIIQHFPNDSKTVRTIQRLSNNSKTVRKI